MSARIPSARCAPPRVEDDDRPLLAALAAAGTAFNGSVHGANLPELFHVGQLPPSIGDWRQDVVGETNGHHWEPVNGRAVRTARYRYAVYQYHRLPKYLDQVDTSFAQEALYGLREDPYQLHNLVPHPEDGDVLADMRRRLERWQGETEDPVRFAWMQSI